MRREKVQVFGAVINVEYHGKPEQVQSNGELTARRAKELNWPVALSLRTLRTKPPSRRAWAITVFVFPREVDPPKCYPRPQNGPPPLQRDKSFLRNQHKHDLSRAGIIKGWDV